MLPIAQADRATGATVRTASYWSGLQPKQMDRAGAPAQLRRPGSIVFVYVSLVGLLLATAALGQLGFSPARLLFVMGCLVVGYQSYRAGGLALHAQIIIVLFAFAPFLRRIVDLHVGYDESGVMLIGPLAAVTIAFLGLRKLMSGRGTTSAMLTPYIVMSGCLGYGWALSSFQGTFVQSSIVAVKYAVPLLYSVCLILEPEQSEAVLRSVTRCFLIIGPIIGLYGVFQHLDPQAWDRYWMVASKIPSIGMPVPGQVRVFSTMNSPVSFAAYATCGLLLLSFGPRSFIPPYVLLPIVILPLCLAILLSSVRTAWFSACLSLVVCLLFGRTRSRATLLIVCLALAIPFALLFTSFGDVIASRFASLDGGVANDGSGHERLGDYLHVFGGDDRYIFGNGFVPVDGDGQLAALDGQVLMSATQMGTTIGVLYIIGVVWAAIQGILCVGRQGSPLRVAAAALVAGSLVILPLTAVAIGEIGILFWMLVGIISCKPRTTAQRQGRIV